MIGTVVSPDLMGEVVGISVGKSVGGNNSGNFSVVSGTLSSGSSSPLGGVGAGVAAAAVGDGVLLAPVGDGVISPGNVSGKRGSGSFVPSPVVSVSSLQRVGSGDDLAVLDVDGEE